MNPTSPLPSTGDPRTPSPQLRTKLNAVHAGPSPPPVPLKELMPSRLDPLNPSLSNNSSPAPCKTMDAMVDSWTTLSLGLPKETPSNSRLPTHTPPEEDKEDHAKLINPRVSVPSLDIKVSPPDLPPK